MSLALVTILVSVLGNSSASAMETAKIRPVPLCFMTQEALAVPGLADRGINDPLSQGRVRGARWRTTILTRLAQGRDTSRHHAKKYFFVISEVLARALWLDIDARLPQHVVQIAGLLSVITVVAMAIDHQWNDYFHYAAALLLIGLFLREVMFAFHHRYWLNTRIPKMSHVPSQLDMVHVLLKRLRSGEFAEWRFIQFGLIDVPYPGLGTYSTAVYWLSKVGWRIVQALSRVLLAPIGIESEVVRMRRSPKNVEGHEHRQELVTLAKCIVSFEKTLCMALNDDATPFWKAFEDLEMAVAALGARPLPVNLLMPRSRKFLDRMGMTEESRARLNAVFPSLDLDTDNADTALGLWISGNLVGDYSDAVSLIVKLAEYSPLLSYRFQVMLHEFSVNRDFDVAVLASDYKYISEGELYVLRLLFSPGLRAQVRAAA